MKVPFIHIVFFLLANPWLIAQDIPNVIHYNKEAYQAHNQNWAIVQGVDRTLYFGNSDGLLTYNGSDWETYHLPKKQIIRALALGGFGKIYSGGYGEFGYWVKAKTGRPEYISLSDSITFERFHKEEIWHILPTSQSIFFQSFSMIYEYFPSDKRIALITPPNNVLFIREVEKELIVPVIGEGVYRLTAARDFQLIAGTEALAKNQLINVISGKDPKSLLIGTERSGLFGWENGTLKPWKNEIQDELKQFQLNKMIRLADGSIALGTILNGAYILDQNGKLIYRINQQQGLQNNTVLSLFEDIDQNLWVGMDRGIDLVDRSTPLTFFKDLSGNIGAVYTSIMHNDDFYVGTNQGLFFRAQEKGESGIPSYTFMLVDGTQGQVWQIGLFEGQLLCGNNAGTFRIKERKAELISSESGGWITLSLPTMTGTLIQGTYTGLVVYFLDQNGDWQFGHRVTGFTEPIKNMLFDSTGAIWVANPAEGLHRLKLSDDLVNVVEVQSFGINHGLPTTYDLQLYQVDGRIIIRTESAIYEFDSKLAKFISCTEIGPFSIQGSSRVIQRGDYWFNVQEDHVEYYHKKHQDPLKLPVSLVPNYELVLPIDSCSFLLGLDDGYAVLNAGKISESNVLSNPKPEVYDITIRGNKVIGLNAFQGPLTFRASENQLKFHFGQKIYTQNPLFQYKLEGFDSNWSSWELVSTKEFISLEPGYYEFMLRSNVSKDQVVVPFFIQYPWYQSGWAWFIYTLCLVGLFYMLFRWHEKRLMRQRLEMEQEAERRLEEERIKTANEQLRNDVVSKSKELANSAVNLVRKDELLQQLKEELSLLKSKKELAGSGKVYQQLNHLIDQHLSYQQDWDLFEENFNQVHDAFFKAIKRDFPELTPGDLKLAAYLKMHLSSKEIAPLLNISIRGVENKRYRLRRKLGLDKEANLVDFMLKY